MIYPVLKFLVRGVCKLLFFVKLVNVENIPKEGAAILAGNHTSLWDPLVLISCTKRSMRAMAKKELFQNQFLKCILEMAGAFPVDRSGSDVGAIKTALKALKNGEIFAIFPSGTRVENEEGASAKAGVALISSRSGVPVIPVRFRGGYRPFHRVTVTFGEPMSITPADGKKATSEELQVFADAIMKKIDGLGA